MKHFTTPDFWQQYNALPADIRQLADKNYDLVQSDPAHPSLQLKEVKGLWSARIGIHYRALAYRDGENFVWFWIGSHAEYDRIIS